MKVNMNSWHFRLVEGFLDGDASRSLCVYFWQVAFRVIFLVMLGIVLWSVCGLFALGLSTAIGWIDPNLTPLWVKGCVAVFGAFVVLAIFALCIVALTLVMFGISKSILVVGELFSRWGDSKEEQEPGVFVSYVKAKKEKICPIIEFTYGDEDES